MLSAVKRSVLRIIVLSVGRCWFLKENESGLRFRRNKIWQFTEFTTPYNRPSTTDSTATTTTTATTATTAPTATTATTAIAGSTASTPATRRRRVLRDVSWSLGL